MAHPLQCSLPKIFQTLFGPIAYRVFCHVNLQHRAIRHDWILDLGPNYETAVVGDPSRDYLWILSRSPEMDEAVYQQLLARMQTRGFSTERMIRTSQISSEPQP